MRPPLEGKREAARRLAAEVWRRMEPVERVLPVRLPGFGTRPAPDDPAVVASRPAAAAAPRAPAAPPPVEDPAARFDAARDRLRATIKPPDDDG